MKTLRNSLLKAAGEALAELTALGGDLEIAAAEAPAEGEAADPTRPRDFEIVVYTGKPMVPKVWPFLDDQGRKIPVVIDANGYPLGKCSISIELQHGSTALPVGQATELIKRGNTLVARGRIMPATEPAREILALHDMGYRWQASMGAAVPKKVLCAAGKTMDVNGRQYQGPLIVGRRVDISEISLVRRGADQDTTVKIAAEMEDEAMGFENWLKVKGYDPKSLTDEEKVELEAQFDAEQASADDASGDDGEEESTSVRASGDVSQIRRQRAAEYRRIAELEAAGANHPGLLAQALDEGWDAGRLETACELADIRASRPQAPSVNPGGTQAMDDVMLEAAACVGGGLESVEDEYKPEVLEAAHGAFRRGISLQELFLIAAHRNGYTGWRFPGHEREILQAAFSTASLSGILGNVSNKFIAQGFDMVESAWRTIAAIGSVADFKQVTSYRLIDGLEYEEVGAGGEISHGDLQEASYTNQARTYAKMLAITRRDLRNDDLGALTVIPQKLGRGAGLMLNKVFWTEFLDNSTFFASGNANYASGATTALSITSLTAAELLFLNQTDENGNPANVEPRILLAPTALLALASQLMRSTVLESKGSTDGSNLPTDNPHAGKFLVVYSRYLGNSAYTGSSATAWYLLGSPQDVPVIQAVFLDGVQTPTIETAEADFNTLGVQMRGYHDFGVTKQEYRAGVKMAGA